MKNHILHYSIIASVLFLGIASLTFPADKNVQLLIVVAVALFYLCYGMLHHHVAHDLTIKIVIEYALVAALLIAVFIFIRGGV